MIKITQGSEAAIKTEMKAKTIEIKEQMKKLRKRIREERKRDNPDVPTLVSLEDDMDDLETELKFYSPSRVLPVQVGDTVVNYKAFLRFLKALDGFNYTVSLESGRLRIDYGVGYAEFRDLSSYYEGFQFIPKGEI
jgi:sugar phosphate isomerase/epimerase